MLFPELFEKVAAVVKWMGERLVTQGAASLASKRLDAPMHPHAHSQHRHHDTEMNEGGEDNDEPSPAVVVTLLVAEDAHHERPLVSTHQPRHLKLGQREELDVELAFLRAEAPNLRVRGNRVREWGVGIKVWIEGADSVQGVHDGR